MIKNYEFLSLFKESEAALRGSQVTEKVHHSIYKRIHSLSNIRAVRSGGLYHLNMPIQELEPLNLPKNSYLSAIKNLINDRLIIQLCVFDFIKETKELKIHSCYFSLPSDENITVKQLYNELIFYSSNSISEFIASKELVSKKDLLKDFEFDFKSAQKPTYEKLSNVLFDPTYWIVPTVFDVSPDPEIISIYKKDLKEELMKQKILLEIFEYGTMQNREDELLIRFEAADEFMRNKIIPKYKSEPNLKMELDSISLEESAYYVEEFNPKTSEFSKKIAESIKKNISMKFSSIRFPGSLAVEVVRTLGDIVSELFQKQYKNNLYQQMQFYVDRLKSLASQSEVEVALYLSQEEIEQIHPKVIDFLINANEIMNVKWNLKDTIMYVFAYKQEEIFYKIVNMLLKEANIENWKILALKFLIERYEDGFPNLFSDVKFKNSYGQLLRKVYINYMPWFYKILIYINFPWFQDKGFQIAKEKITEEQVVLEEINQKMLEEKKLQKIQEKREKLSKATDIAQVIQIMDKVQNFFIEGKIPTIKKILQELIGWEEKQFLDFLQQKNFELFPLKEDKVILYPKNFNWKIYANRIQQIIIQHLNQKNQKIEQNLSDFIKLRSFLEAKLKGSRALPELEEDPYKKFEAQIQKEKQKEKLKKKPLDDESLEI
ncbi:MAG: hypothetical protein ACK4UJ_02175 [Leptonema sp. (in: bacteria)]